MITFAKLWFYLGSKGMKRSDLRQVIAPVTLAKMGRNESVTTDTIDKICSFLNCQPGDIMEYLTEEQVKDLQTKLDSAEKEVTELQGKVKKLLESMGISEEEYEQGLKESTEEFISNLKQK